MSTMCNGIALVDVEDYKTQNEVVTKLDGKEVSGYNSLDDRQAKRHIRSTTIIAKAANDEPAPPIVPDPREIVHTARPVFYV